MEKFIDLISRRVSTPLPRRDSRRTWARSRCPTAGPVRIPVQRRHARGQAAHRPPLELAEAVAAQLRGEAMFARVEAVRPGFLNFTVDPAYLRDYVARMAVEPAYGLEREASPKTVVVDYGGPNVAKPLHVGHLRSAIIGESVKRIGRYFGNKVIGDIHMGDWGLQMG